MTFQALSMYMEPGVTTSLYQNSNAQGTVFAASFTSRKYEKEGLNPFLVEPARVPDGPSTTESNS